MDNSQESLNETQTLQIPSNLLKSIRHQSKDVLAQKCNSTHPLHLHDFFNFLCAKR